MRRAVLSRMYDLLEQSYVIDRSREEFVRDVLSLHEIDAILSFKSDPHLDELRGALDRIEDDTFGICIGCKADIGQEQLVDDPARRMCSVCEHEFNKPVLYPDNYGVHP